MGKEMVKNIETSVKYFENYSTERSPLQASSFDARSYNRVVARDYARRYAGVTTPMGLKDIIQYMLILTRMIVLILYLSA